MILTNLLVIRTNDNLRTYSYRTTRKQFPTYHASCIRLLASGHRLHTYRCVSVMLLEGKVAAYVMCCHLWIRYSSGIPIGKILLFHYLNYTLYMSLPPNFIHTVSYHGIILEPWYSVFRVILSIS